MLVRRLGAFHVVADVRAIELDAIRLWFADSSTITLGPEGLVEIARQTTRASGYSPLDESYACAR